MRRAMAWVFTILGLACVIVARWQTSEATEFQSLLARWYMYAIGAVLGFAGLKIFKEH